MAPHPENLRLLSISLHNFRGHASITLRPGKLTVLVGINGAGKSALLQGVAIGLSRLTSRIVTGRANGIQISAQDIRIEQAFAAINLILKWRGELYGQAVFCSLPGRKAPKHLTEIEYEHKDLDPSAKDVMPSINRVADQIRTDLTENAIASLPVIALYPVNRAVTEIPVRIRGRHRFDQVAAYEGAFQSQRNFRTFFEWFREREDLENERRIDEQGYRDPQLQAVRNAVEMFMAGYSNLRVRRNPLRMTLCKEQVELRIDQLSDGEKVILSLVGDLARRFAIANPGLKNPLEGEGVILIDELELHLHPVWQREVVQALPQVFRNAQFLVTTHSPIIASSVPMDSLYVVSPGAISLVGAYGQEVGVVLSDIFGVPPRLEAIQAELDSLFLLMHQRQIPEARRKIQDLEALIGPSDPELVRARTMLAGYEAL